MISKKIDITGYFGFPGEPALGPVAFMHRVSALNNPDAPLSHHWQDATHINFGVTTISLRLGICKLEGSVFTGREPDELRYNFDKPKFDSYSYRLSCNPTRQLALQVSQAYLQSPEVAEPHKNIQRSTASLIHHIPFRKENSYLASAIIFGNNTCARSQNSFLFESTLQLDRTAIYMRYEWVEKDAEELDLTQFINGKVPVYKIQALTIGMNRVLIRKSGFNTALGVQGSIFIASDELNNLYGKNPLAAEVYLRFYPHLMHMHHIGSKKNQEKMKH